MKQFSTNNFTAFIPLQVTHLVLNAQISNYKFTASNQSSHLLNSKRVVMFPKQVLLHHVKITLHYKSNVLYAFSKVSQSHQCKSTTPDINQQTRHEKKFHCDAHPNLIQL